MVRARQQGVSRGAFEAEGKRAGEGLSAAGDGRPHPGLMRTRPAAPPARGPTSQSSGQQLHGLRDPSGLCADPEPLLLGLGGWSNSMPSSPSLSQERRDLSQSPQLTPLTAKVPLPGEREQRDRLPALGSSLCRQSQAPWGAGSDAGGRGVCGVGPCSRAPTATLQEECGCPAPGGRRDLICSFQRALTPPATEDQSTFRGGRGCGGPTRPTWFSLVFWGVSATSRLPRSFTPHCWLWTPPSAAKRVSPSFFPS